MAANMSGTMVRRIKTTAELIYSMRVLAARDGDAAQAGRALFAKFLARTPNKEFSAVKKKQK